jgi:hypothetical protein
MIALRGTAHDIVPWIEPQLGSRIWGIGLNGSKFEAKQVFFASASLQC